MILTLLFILIFTINTFAVEISIDAAVGRTAISPSIYGKNNCLSDNPGDPLTEKEWQFLRDTGIKIFRESGGNNSTKYNWQLKLTSHPDWYNNVYSHDWDFTAQSIQDNLANAKGMWGFQLIGKVAANKNNNFNDWGYNQSQWWEGVHNNWAGGGGPDTGEGNPDLYLTDWSAESTVGIVEHWFSNEGLGLDKNRFNFWNMDNEPEIWSGTHDDVYPEQLPAEEFMQKYFEVAKKAREIFPEIKLVGPVPANEWQWYNWDNDKIQYENKSYTWLEYFIKRVGDEQKATGMRLLDVLDIHFYPGESDPEDIVQLHRVWFDKSYDYPGANGVKRAGSGGWNNSITKEYIFARCTEWLEKHIGSDHGVTFGVSEMGINGDNPNVTAVWYASTLGVFADNNVELFTPWSWKTGMYEVIHLMSHSCKEISVSSVSDEEEFVSAYSSINIAGDSLTVVLINRSINSKKDVTINLSHFSVIDGDYTYKIIRDLPNSETFKSHTDNALRQGSIAVANNSFSVSLPSLSVTAVLLMGTVDLSSVTTRPEKPDLKFDIYPNPFNPSTNISFHLSKTMNVKLDVFDVSGRHIKTVQNRKLEAGAYIYRLDGAELVSGVYFVKITMGTELFVKKALLLK